MTPDLEEAVKRLLACHTCNGTGEELSRVCHCGESMDAAGVFAHDNHSPLEMVRECESCKPARMLVAELRRLSASVAGTYPTAKPLAERYWSKVVVNEDGCWGWNGNLKQAGYGYLTVTSPGTRQTTMGAHRISGGREGSGMNWTREAMWTVDPVWDCPRCKAKNAGHREICRICDLDSALLSGGYYFPVQASEKETKA